MSLSRSTSLLAFLLLAAPQLRATWSIIVVDTRTKEIGTAPATCVTGYDLKFLASVVDAAEQELRNTQGDIASKLMAAMEAARKMGGDGRCSCSTSSPTGCGSPPKSFTKSADIGYMVIARLCDKDGPCNTSVGCPSGRYYMDLNVANQSWSSPDPALQLRTLYDKWRKALQGRPDQLRSTLELDRATLPADGQTRSMLSVQVRDIDGKPVTSSGLKLNVSVDAASQGMVGVGTVQSLGQGRFSVPIVAGLVPGKVVLNVSADDGQGGVLLAPLPALQLVSDSLWSSHASFSATQGAQVDFVLQGGAARAGRGYLIVGGNSGSMPGIPLAPSVTVPVNPDPLFGLLLQLVNTPVLPGAAGFLDQNGFGRSSFVAPPGILLALQGTKLSFGYATLLPFDFAGGPAVIEVRR